MQNISFTNYTIGEDAYEAISTVCSIYENRLQIIGGHKAILAVQPSLEKALKNSSIQLLEPLWYGGECTLENIELLVTQARKNGAGLIAGVGGGKAIDTAKCVASILNLPIITIPTIAATCAATTALSVLYDSNHKFDRFIFFDNPPTHSFINSGIIASAPSKYLRAGMGDTLAKHYECTFSARGDKLNFTSALGCTISSMCSEPLFEHGTIALKDCEEHNVTPSLEQIIQANVVNTGMVSLLVDEDYNGAVAHSLFYGLTLFPHIEKNYLHGDVVAYGILVQLMIDRQLDEALKVRKLLSQLGCPVTLKDIEVSLDRDKLLEVLKETVNSPDMEHLPYKISEDMVYDSICMVENLAKTI